MFLGLLLDMGEIVCIVDSYMAIWQKENDLKYFIRVMKALSDPNRVKIIKMLGLRELCVCEITAILGLAQPTVSKHLKVLEAAGLVDSSKDGAWVNYRLADQEDSEYARIMQEHMRTWLDDDPLIQQVCDQVGQVDRVRICAV